ncbi:MAG: SPOR domain-containing protein [Treponema sp.]|jgi:cell division septation protein DedD|nr:SPOR domain-containing protein [Treponema sp.]
MKKFLVACGLLSVILGPLAAQTFNPAAYGEETLSGFNAWRESYAEEDRQFKIPVLYSSADGSSMLFVDPGLEGEIKFETEDPWPAMTSGQKVTIYFSAQGPWVWDRQLEAIEYGSGRLVQAGGAETPAQGTRAPEERSAAGVPVTAPVEITSSRETAPDPAAFDYGRAPRTSPRQVVIQISGNPPQEGRYYRLQVGSFSVRGNATRAANSLREAGLTPAFEEYQNNVRVVLSHVAGEDVVETARKIGSAGFTEVWCREEP